MMIKLILISGVGVLLSSCFSRYVGLEEYVRTHEVDNIELKKLTSVKKKYVLSKSLLFYKEGKWLYLFDDESPNHPLSNRQQYEENPGITDGYLEAGTLIEESEFVSHKPSFMSSAYAWRGISLKITSGENKGRKIKLVGSTFDRDDSPKSLIRYSPKKKYFKRVN